MRHAETAAPGLFHGAESDIELGERGCEQARFAATTLLPFKPSALYCSGLRRAQQTAQLLSERLGLSPQIVPELHERVMGPLSGACRKSFNDVYEQTRSRWESGQLEFTHSGGESYRDIHQRVLPPFLRIAKRHAGETIVVVAHGVVIRVLLTSLVPELSPDRFSEIQIGFVAPYHLQYDGRSWRLLGYYPSPQEHPPQEQDMPPA